MELCWKGCLVSSVLIALLQVTVVLSADDSVSSESDNSQGVLADVLNTFEKLEHIDIQHTIVKRSTEQNPGHIKEVKFDTLGKHFHARLHSRYDVVASDFRAYMIDAENNKKEIKVDTEELYQGYLTDEPDSSKVFAHWEGNALLAKIETKSDVYYVEPAWRFLNESNSNEMITYKASDMKNDAASHENGHKGSKFCGYVSVPDQFDNSTSNEESRVRRRASQDDGPYSAPAKNTCPLLLVADYRFFENMGQKSASRTTTYLLGLVDRVDAIYRNTDFGQGYKGMGFEVKEIVIHEAPKNPEDGEHYNVLKDKWETKHLLEVFSRDPYFQQFCLVHLLTHQAFVGGVLGLAYIGSPRSYSVGGICTPVYYKGGHPLFLNTGWSSSLNSYKRRILTQEADLVTTHEFGHNWGSEHDPDTQSCSPSGDAGGKYIMYTYSVPGYDKHNKLFSPCSRASMQEVLQSKSHKCFTEQQGAYCGNQKIEGNEECDGGSLMRKGHDTCCHTNCKLRIPSAQCSDVNHICCQGCRFLGKDVMCRDGNSLDAGCKASTNCNGISGDCPEAKSKNESENCLERGKCKEGVCQPFCELKGKVPCICDIAEDSCKWCCRDKVNSSCVPFLEIDNFIPLTNGTPCVQGYCNNLGVCMKQEGELVQRLWNIIENLNPSRLVAFMRANIVGTVIILSLILWIPGSCIIWCLDRRRQKEEEDTTDWLSYQNPTLTRIPHDLPPRFPSIERAKRRTARVCQNIQANQAKTTLA